MKEMPKHLVFTNKPKSKPRPKPLTYSAAKKLALESCRKARRLSSVVEEIQEYKGVLATREEYVQAVKAHLQAAKHHYRAYTVGVAQGHKSRTYKAGDKVKSGPKLHQYYAGEHREAAKHYKKMAEKATPSMN